MKYTDNANVIHDNGYCIICGNRVMQPVDFAACAACGKEICGGCGNCPDCHPNPFVEMGIELEGV